MDSTDSAYADGRRSAFREMLQRIAAEFGNDGREGSVAALLAERSAAVVALRAVCAEYDADAWSDDLHLGDAIDKHLHRALDRRVDVAVLSERQRCALRLSDAIVEVAADAPLPPDSPFRRALALIEHDPREKQ